MRVEQLAGELLETRLHPVHRSVAPRAAPGLVLAGGGALLAVVSASGAWGDHGRALSIALVIATGFAGALVGRSVRTATFPPVLAAAAVSMLSLEMALGGPVPFLLLAASGVLWAGVVEALRRGTYVDLTTHGIVVKAGWMASPVRFRYVEIHGVEAHGRGRSDWGTLSVETEHGLVPIPGVPGVKTVEQRILTRVQSGEPSPQEDAAVGVAARVRTLLGPQQGAK